MKRIASRFIALIIVNVWNTLVVTACYTTGLLAMVGTFISYLFARFTRGSVAARWYCITASLDEMILSVPATIDRKYMLSL